MRNGKLEPICPECGGRICEQTLMGGRDANGYDLFNRAYCVNKHAGSLASFERAAEIKYLFDVIHEVHSQHADDLCWLAGIDKIFVAAGLPAQDRSVGDKAAMLANCSRFIDQLCTGKKEWPSYRDLENRISELEHELSALRNAVAMQPASVVDDVAHWLEVVKREQS